MIVDKGKHYIYRHVTLKGVVFYIGRATKSEKDIKNNTYSRAYHKRDRTNLWTRTSKKYGYIIDILIETNDFKFLCEKEKEFIKLYGRRKLKTGTLVNFTEGGESGGGEGGKAKRIRVYMYNLDGKYIKSFNSIINVAKRFKIHPATINQCLYGKQVQTHGFQFRDTWVNEIPPIKYRINRYKGVIHINLITNMETIYRGVKDVSEKTKKLIEEKITHNLCGESKK